VLLSVGSINNHKNALYDIKEFTLDENERLIGIKSGLRENGVARHWDL